MRRFWGPAFFAATFFLAEPAVTHAQMEFSLDEVEAEEKDDTPARKQDLIEELAAEEAPEGPTEEGPQREETVEEIYAVQQIYALRLKRFELAASGAFTLNDPFLSHPGIGVAANYWFTNVLAIGLNWIWYDFGNPLDREANLTQRVQRSFRLGVPITEWQQGLWANFTYVPFYGKFSAFRKFIFQWDSYIIGGVGFMRTKPLPVFDPEFRQFDYGFRVSFNIGIGVRIFLTRYLGIFFEFRDYMFLERFENPEVDVLNRDDPSTWLAGSAAFFNNASIQFGLTVFFPIKFEYRLPK